VRNSDFVWTQVWARILRASRLYLKTVLKHDRKGLSEGKKPKVTHFAPFDFGNCSRINKKAEPTTNQTCKNSIHQKVRLRKRS